LHVLFTVSLAAALGATKPAATTKPAEASKPAPKEISYRLTDTWEIGGKGAWSATSAAEMTLDDSGKLLFIPRPYSLQVVDTSTGKQVADITIGEPRGVALVPELNRGFVSSRAEKAVTVIDLKTFEVLGKIETGDFGEYITYDPSSKRVFIGCPVTMTVIPIPANIDLKTGKPETPFQFDGFPNGILADGLGMVYVVIRDKDQMAVIDTRSMTLATRWELTRWRLPTSIAMDRRRSRLFIGARGRVMVVSATDGHELGDAETGLANQWIGAGGVAFHDDHAYAAAGDGNILIVGQNAAGKFVVEGKIDAGPGARALVMDPKSGRMYVPTTEPEVQEGKRKVPAPMKVLVFEKN
jgi:DNA-binding beta-propeller fold protein YncE